MQGSENRETRDSWSQAGQKDSSLCLNWQSSDYTRLGFVSLESFEKLKGGAVAWRLEASPIGDTEDAFKPRPKDLKPRGGPSDWQKSN